MPLPLSTIIVPNEHILILEDRKYRYWAYLFQQLAEKHSLQIGIGLAEGLFRQSLSYHSAKLAIQSLLSDQKLALYDELNLELLLAGTSTETRQCFLKKTIRPLNEKERIIPGRLAPSLLKISLVIVPAGTGATHYLFTITFISPRTTISSSSALLP